ncbi:hypothetical protein AB4097_01390 [Microvirga sp. 2MCAF35]|uniref:hypothetical protein n=1 Tax=Microvirga sp. 2MCAF35 TaxID=3232987 RepID=UPI003F94989E
MDSKRIRLAAAFAVATALSGPALAEAGDFTAVQGSLADNNVGTNVKIPKAKQSMYFPPGSGTPSGGCRTGFEHEDPGCTGSTSSAGSSGGEGGGIHDSDGNGVDDGKDADNAAASGGDATGGGDTSGEAGGEGEGG